MSQVKGSAMMGWANSDMCVQIGPDILIYMPPESSMAPPSPVPGWPPEEGHLAFCLHDQTAFFSTARSDLAS